MVENEVLSLQEELVDTRKKLQDYADTIVSLHGELRTLRDGICNACKQKFVPANLRSSQDIKTRAVASSSIATRFLPPQALPRRTNPVVRPPRRHGVSPLSKLSRPPTSTHTPPPPPHVVANVQKNTTPIVGQHISSSKAIIPTIEPSSISRWSVERGSRQALEVSFVRALINKYRVNSVRFSPDGKYLAAGLDNGDGRVEDGAVVIYNVETGEQTCVLAEHSSQYSSEERRQIFCLSFCPSGRYLAAGDSGQVTVWDISNKRIRSIFRGHSSPVESVTFSPNGRFLVSVGCEGDAIRLWNLRDGTTRSFSNAGDLWCARFSPDGKYISAGNRFGIIMIWDVRTGRMVKRWNSDGGPISRVAFTQDEMGLLSGHKNGSVINWNIGVVQSNGGAVATKSLEYKGLDGWIYGTTLSPCNRWVAAIAGHKAVMWNIDNGMQQGTLIGHEDLVRSVDFSPSGKYLALGSWDGHVTVWKYASP